MDRKGWELTLNQADAQTAEKRSDSHEHRDLKEQEKIFRAALASIVGAVSVFIATLLVSILIPIFPISVAVLLSIVLGVLAYKVRPLAVMIMLAAAMFGYIYQLGLPVSFIVIISIILFFTSFFGLQSGSILGIATGVIAASLMVTPFYFLGILLLVAVPLFRARGRSVGSTAAVIVFILLFVPLLVYEQNGTGAPFLFTRVILATKPPLTFVNFNSIISQLSTAIPTSSQALSQYMDKLSYFLPVFNKPGDPFGNLLGVLLGGFLAVGIASAFGIMALMRWLEGRETGGKILPWIAPAAAILLGALVFLIPLTAMKQPFMYQVSIDAGVIAGMLAGTVVLGGIGGIIELWLRRRDLMIVLQDELTALVKSSTDTLNYISDRIRQAKIVCIGIDIGHEELIVHNISEELSLVSQGARHLSIEVLQEKVNLFKQREEQLSKTSTELITKVRRYCEDSRQKYKECTAGYSELGYSFMSKPTELAIIDFGQAEFNNLMESQNALNALYKKAAKDAMEAVEATQNTVRRELESDVGRTSIEIARNYLTQGTYVEVVDTLLVESININHVVTQSIMLLGSRVNSIMQEFRGIIKTILIPAMDQVGDNAGVNYYSGLLINMERADWLQKVKGNLIDKTQWIIKTRDLAEIAVSVLTDMSKRLSSLEKGIISRAPSGFNWGSNSNVQADLSAFSTNQAYSPKQDSMPKRVVQTEKALQVIENAAPLIIEYARIYEFLINYINLEYLMDERLLQHGEIKETDIPVKLNYAQQYLRLYSENHPERVYIEAGTGKIKKRS